MVGERALILELYKAGFAITDVNPDFVVVRGNAALLQLETNDAQGRLLR